MLPGSLDSLIDFYQLIMPICSRRQNDVGFMAAGDFQPGHQSLAAGCCMFIAGLVDVLALPGRLRAAAAHRGPRRRSGNARLPVMLIQIPFARVGTLAGGARNTCHIHSHFDILHRSTAWETFLTWQLQMGTTFPFVFFFLRALNKDMKRQCSHDLGRCRGRSVL